MSHESEAIDMSMKVPKHSVMGIWRRNTRRSDLSWSRVMKNSSSTMKSRLTIIVHCPMVKGVNMLNT